MMKLFQNKLLVIVSVLVVLAVGALLFANSTLDSKGVLSFLKVQSSTSTEAVAKKSVDFLNKNVLQEGQTAELVSFSEESGVIKLKLKIGDTTYDSYTTRDGKLLFPEAFPLEGDGKATAANSQDNTKATPETVAKVATAQLDAYVVSDCPYGLQMQRAMAEAVKSAPALAQNVKVRYIGSITGSDIYSMHDTDAAGNRVANGLEAKENLRQICIREEQSDKYWNYISRYIQKSAGNLPNTMPIGDSAAALAFAGVDTSKLNACMTDSTRGLKYAKEDFDLQAKYGVQGSPTLILNGSKVDETPFGGRSAKGVAQLICSSSTTPSAFCKDAKLSVDQAATSFSVAYAGTGATGAVANCVQ